MSATVTLDLFNPSIGDYVLHRYSTDLPFLRAGFASLRSASTIETLLGLVSSGLIGKDHGVNLAEHVLRNAHLNAFISYEADHIAAAARFILEHTSPHHDQTTLIRAAVDFLLSTAPPFHFLDAANVIEWAIECGDCNNTLLETWAAAACSKSPYPDEIHAIARILEALSDESQARVAPALEAATVEYIADNARDEFDTSDVFGNADPYDLQPARDALEALALQRLDEYGADPSVDNVRAIIEAYDVDSQAETYFADYDSDDDTREYPRSESTDQIDDLFERT
jgi:hypothetical protein